ncbi:MAG: hypothetical protein HZA78_04985 [Candidatus Schekmanbacteria bacterium]|nr:hypothetical protein [Candidatus Schekmanbacteria bacterium]
MALQDREKTIIWIGGVIILLIIAYRWGITPVMESQAGVRDKLAANSLILAKSNNKIARQKELETQIKTVNGEITLAEKNLLKGETPSLAAAELQKLLKNITNKENVKISSEKIISPQDADEYQKIPVQIALNCLVSDLRKVLFQIENCPTALIVAETKIKVNDVRNPSNVEAMLTVFGLIKNKMPEDDGQQKQEAPASNGKRS